MSKDIICRQPYMRRGLPHLSLPPEASAPVGAEASLTFEVINTGSLEFPFRVAPAGTDVPGKKILYSVGNIWHPKLDTEYMSRNSTFLKITLQQYI